MRKKEETPSPYHLTTKQKPKRGKAKTQNKEEKVVTPSVSRQCQCAPCPFPCLFFVCIATCCSQLLSQPLPPRQGLHPSIGIGLVSADRCATRCATVSVDVFDSFAFFVFVAYFCIYTPFSFSFPFACLLSLSSATNFRSYPPPLLLRLLSHLCLVLSPDRFSLYSHTHTHTLSLVDSFIPCSRLRSLFLCCYLTKIEHIVEFRREVVGA